MLAHNPGADAHTREQLRFCVRCHGMVRADQYQWLTWTSPTVVDNAEHPVLRQRTGRGVVMISFDGYRFSLSWLPLLPGRRPQFDTIRYFHAGRQSWSDFPDGSAGYELFAHPLPGWRYTHVSASWLPGPRCWIVLFSAAFDGTNEFSEPIVARFSPNLIHWSEQVMMFEPSSAYGVWMHDPDPTRGDTLTYAPPPPQPTDQNHPGWPYGAFLIDRYTTWNATSRNLTVVYLMSTSSPYQVQLMETTLVLPDPVV